MYLRLRRLRFNGSKAGGMSYVELPTVLLAYGLGMGGA